MRPRPMILAAIVACLAPSMAGAGEILNIGDPAPPLTVSSFVKGEKIEKFEPGKTYVVEFWATWCGPCRASIPHLTELAHKYKDKGVRFIGVDVWERDTKLVAPFLAEMGDKMDYSVALDDVPKGGDGKAGDPNNGAMAKGWMQAAEENGIPAAFVIRDGKIAWIGHPMNMDGPLARIVDGDCDFAELAKKRLAEKVKERKVSVVQMKVYTPYRAKDFKATLAPIDEVAASDPETAEEFAPVKFTALCNLGETDAALSVGEKLFEKYKDNGPYLNNVFFYAVDLDLKNEPDPRVARLALKALRRADELTDGKDMATIDSLAVALYRTGDYAGAVLAEEKALKILKEQAPNGAHPYYKLFEQQLTRFRKAVDEKGPKP
jgi:thiol-disulfide isomerase/thioredoxin